MENRQCPSCGAPATGTKCEHCGALIPEQRVATTNVASGNAATPLLSNIQTMNKQRIAMLVASVLGILAVFMPWFSIPIVGSLNGVHAKFDGMGWIMFGIFVLPLVVSLLGDRTEELAKNKLAAAGAGLINVFFGIYVISQLKRQMSGMGAIGSSTSIGFGLYLVIIVGISICAISLAWNRIVSSSQTLSGKVKNGK